MPKTLDLAGKRFGMLTALEFSGRNSYKARMWLCICDCGNFSRHVSWQLTKGDVQSCGCRQGNHGKDPESPHRHLFSDYKYSASKRGLKFELSYEEFRDLTQQNCHYCGQTPQPRFRKGGMCANGVDRKSPTLGYVCSNVVPACAECNMAKGDRSYRQFEIWVGRLLSFRK